MRQAIFSFYVFLSAFALHGQTSSTVSLGIITDYEQSRLIDSFFQIIAEQIDQVTGLQYDISLRDNNIRYEQGDYDLARQTYQDLTSGTDIILLLGGNSIGGPLQGELSVPTIALDVSDPILLGLPYDQGVSGVDNFSYLWRSRDLVGTFEEFQRVFPFDSLAVLVSAESASAFYNEEVLDSVATRINSSITLVPVDEDIDGSLASIGDNYDAVYIRSLLGRSMADIRQICEILKIQQVPSFTNLKSYVDLGMLAAIADEDYFEQSMRRLALMIDDVLSGEPLSEMPVEIDLEDELFLNLGTAREIGYSLPFTALFTANVIEDDNLSIPSYSLEEIVELAIEANLSIKISNNEIDLNEQDIALARSSLYPQIDISFAGSQINPGSASDAFMIPERQLTGDLALNQIVFSEKALAGYKVSQILKVAQEYSTQGDILSVIGTTYNAYFNLLLAKTQLAIQKENLEYSKSNLGYARIRQSAGTASIAEIYRWESEVANAYQGLVEAQTRVEASKLQLNTLLANSLVSEFSVNDVTIQDNVYQDYRDNPITGTISTPRDLESVADFLVNETLQNHPDKRALLQNIQAAERLLKQNERLLYLPEVGLQAQTSQVLLRGGKGSEEIPGGMEFINNTWQVGLFANYPIFQGKARRAEIDRSKIQLEQLSYSNTQLDQELELAVRTSVLDVVAATTNIVFSESAASNADLNFELVQDNYREGTVNITQVIDAQQAALSANQRYAISIYEYLVAQLQLEFSTGTFSAFWTNAEKQQFLQDYERYRVSR